MSLTAKDLNAALWSAADEMRHVMSADVYKDYLLGLVFYKALSDKILVEAYSLLNDTKPKSLETAQQAYGEFQKLCAWYRSHEIPRCRRRATSTNSLSAELTLRLFG